MGSSPTSTTQVIQPTPPPQPSTAEAIQEYVKSLPQIFQAQLEFAPQEAQQQLQLAQQYALPYAEIAKQAQSALYPETSALQEELAAQARQGLNEGAPQSVRQQFLDNYRANLGTNAGSQIGATGTAKALAQLDEIYKQNAINLALSVSGRQPLQQPSSPQFTNQLGNFSPAQALNYQASTYGTFAGANRPLLGQTTYRTGSQQFNDYASGIGNLVSFNKTF